MDMNNFKSIISFFLILLFFTSCDYYSSHKLSFTIVNESSCDLVNGEIESIYGSTGCVGRIQLNNPDPVKLNFDYLERQDSIELNTYGCFNKASKLFRSDSLDLIPFCSLGNDILKAGHYRIAIRDNSVSINPISS